MNADQPYARAATPAGLSERCVNVRVVSSQSGTHFYRCGLASTDPRFAKYPRLPVLRCAGYARKD
jgi:hypothetical protein